MQVIYTLGDLFLAESAPYRIGGNQPFLLDDPDSVWFVQEGKVEIFLVAVNQGVPDDTRYHVATVDEGGLFIGTAAGSGRDVQGLLAVAQPNTALVRLGLPRLRELAALPEWGASITDLLEGWLARLAESLTRGLFPPRTEVQLSAGEIALAEPRQKVGPLKGNLWVTFRRDQALFMGEESFGTAPEEVTFPLYSKTWLTARSQMSLKAQPLEDLILTDGAWEGLNLFYQMFFQVKFTSVRLEGYDGINRLRKRAEFDQALKHKTLRYLASVVEHRREGAETLAISADKDPLLEAIRQVGAYQGLTIIKPASFKPASRYRNYAAELAVIARASRFRTREVKLEGNWWQTDCGPLLAIQTEGKRPVALLPAGNRGYVLFNPQDGSRTKLTAPLAEGLEQSAHYFYRSFPDKAIGTRDLLKFGLRGTRSDRRMLIALAALAGILGLFTPILTGQVFDSFIPTGQSALIVQVGIVLVVVALSGAAMQITRSIAILRLETRLDFSVQAAIWDRLLSLPAPFFRQYSSGDLAARALGIENIRHLVSESVSTAVLNSIFSLFSLALLFTYNVGLALVALGLTFITLVVIIGISRWQLCFQRQQTEQTGRISGAVLQLISGVAKLRVAGAEVRAFASWARLFGEQRRLTFRARLISNFQLVFSAAWPAVTFLVIFAFFDLMTGHKMTTGNFLAFLTAFGQFFTAMIALAVALITVSAAIPLYERTRPILEALPEVDQAKLEPGELSGAIEINHLTFRYSPELPPVLNDISLTIGVGQMVALVGPSGSGKSSLVRLLLGFEAAESGSILFDNQDAASLDIQAVRRQLGVVIQNGRLMTGDIFSNIVGSMPYTVEQAWEAARMAGIEADIKDMPMGMYTLVSESGGNLSGGQRQRIMIARAIINKPRILLFDEATSALDNQTQTIVSRSLESLQATRIVIAHRLSTIVNADCIFVLSGGKIVQSGTYQELMAQPGPFQELARRQLV